MERLSEFLAARPGLKFVFTGGKGGVGKTVGAATLAYYFARQGKRTLLASLNPVHSLSSVFGQPLSGGTVQPVAGVDNLSAIEVETAEAVERYRQNIAVRVREFLRWADIPVDSRPFVEIAVTNPAFEESAMFDRMVDLMLSETDAFDAVVFDTAAVANAVRLIGLSQMYGLWLNRMIESRKEALSLRVQLSFRRERVMAEVAKDPLMADLLAMHDRFQRVKSLLTDPDLTAFFFVTLPLSLPISVVTRFISMVKQYEIPVGGVLVNQVIQANVAADNADDVYLQNKYAEQRQYMEAIQQSLGDLVRGYVPLYPTEVTGVDMVQRVADDLFNPANDWQAEFSA